MTNEEMQRAMEFIAERQAQYEAGLEKDTARQAKLEESFTLLTELARRRRKPTDPSARAMDTLRRTMSELAQRMSTLDEIQSGKIHGGGSDSSNKEVEPGG